MKILLASIPILFIPAPATSQHQKSIEVNVEWRHDKHADYTTRYFSRSYTNDTKLWGNSFGFNLNYNHPLKKNFKLKTGLGYYRLGIDKIRQATRFGTIATGRNIDYDHPSGIQPLFATQKYHYNNLAFLGGLIYGHKLSKKWNYNLGAEFRYLYSFSQLYHITYDDIKYQTKNSRSLGFGINTSVGVSKNLFQGNYYISPRIIIPIYQNLNGDPELGEGPDVQMRKWFDGIGASFSIGKYLK